MTRGGYRAGSGRKKGSRNKKHVVVVHDPSVLMPIDWMLAVLRDPEAEQNRRDMMAREAAPYVHARLSAAMVTAHSNTSSRGDDNTNALQVLSVPKGARVNTKNGIITIDGERSELQPIEPFTGTPALTDKRDHNDRDEPERERFEVTEITPPENVSRLDSFRNRRDNDDNDGGPDAA
jgi:hypothetical protein